MSIDQLEEIFLSFAYKDDDVKKAYSAFDQLYKEYSKFLYSVVRKNLFKMEVSDEEVVGTVVSNVFLTLYEKPPMNFEAKIGNSVDASFKAYLSKVAKNETLHLFKDYYKTNLVLQEDIKESVFEDTEIEENIIISVNQKTMIDALNTLNERDREILLTLYLYYEEGKKTPTPVLNMICERFGTTKDNIRQIKRRSEAKILQHFSKYSQLKPVKNVR